MNAILLYIIEKQLDLEKSSINRNLAIKTNLLMQKPTHMMVVNAILLYIIEKQLDLENLPSIEI